MSDSQIIKNIIAALANRGVASPTDLSVAIGYDQGNLSKIVNGKKPISSGLREKLHTKYGIRHEFMMTGTGKIFEEESNSTTEFGVDEVKSLQSKVQELEAEVRLRDEIIKGKNQVIESNLIAIDALRTALNKSNRIEEKTEPPDMKKEKVKK